MIRSITIVVVSTILGVLADWRVPSIDRFLWDVLRSMRGAAAAPGDIAIVAIDEKSIASLGPFPWPRTVMARAIEAIAAARPKVIALDVLYVDPLNTAQDSELAGSMAKAGNVVAATQLVESQGAKTWLLPLPEIARAAAALGHINVLKNEWGIERDLAMRPTDDAGRAIYPMAVQVVLAGGSATHLPRTPVLTIDFIGPAGSFSRRTLSLVDVIDGRVPAADLRGKYVLIGATAAALGGRIVCDRHGGSMAGVEALANGVNTILRTRFYSETQNLNEVLYAALAALLTVGLLSRATRPTLRIGVLLAIAVAIVGRGYISYACFLVYPAWAAELVSFASAAILALLWRSRRSLTVAVL